MGGDFGLWTLCASYLEASIISYEQRNFIYSSSSAFMFIESPRYYASVARSTFRD